MNKYLYLAIIVVLVFLSSIHAQDVDEKCNDYSCPDNFICNDDDKAVCYTECTDDDQCRRGYNCTLKTDSVPSSCNPIPVTKTGSMLEVEMDLEMGLTVPQLNLVGAMLAERCSNHSTRAIFQQYWEKNDNGREVIFLIIGAEKKDCHFDPDQWDNAMIALGISKTADDLSIPTYAKVPKSDKYDDDCFGDLGKAVCASQLSGCPPCASGQPCTSGGQCGNDTCRDELCYSSAAVSTAAMYTGMMLCTLLFAVFIA